MAITQSALAHAMARDLVRAAPPEAGIKRVWVWSQHGYVDPARDYVELAVLHDEMGEETQNRTSDTGDGPLDALFRAIEDVTGVTVVVRDFRVHSVTRGKDAQGESTIEVEHQGRVYRGRGVSTDTVEAAALAFLNAVNRASRGGGQAITGVRPDMV